MVYARYSSMKWEPQLRLMLLSQPGAEVLFSHPLLQTHPADSFWSSHPPGYTPAVKLCLADKQFGVGNPAYGCKDTVTEDFFPVPFFVLNHNTCHFFS